MAKVFNHERYETTAQGNYNLITPAVVELPNHMIIDGQYHDKSSLSPIPFKFLKFPGRDNFATGRVTWIYDDLLTSTAHAPMGGMYAVRPSDGAATGTGFTVDSEDSNKGLWMSVGNANASLIWQDINLNTKTRVADGYTEGSSAEGMTYGYIVDQTVDAYIGLAQHTRTYQGYYHCVHTYVDKDDMGWHETAPAATSYRYGRNQYLCSSSDYVFVYNQWMYTDHNYMSITKHDKTNLASAPAASSVYTVTNASANQGWTVVTQARADGINDDTFYGFNPVTGVDAFHPFMITVHKNLGTADIDSTGLTYDFATAGTTRSAVFNRPEKCADLGQLRLESWIVNGTSHDFVCLGIAESTDFSTEIAASFRVYIFRINPADRTELIYTATIDPSLRMRACFPIEDDWTMVGLIHDGGMRIYSWNNGTETYDFVQDYSAAPKSVMRDSLERIWIVDTSNDIHMFSATTATTVTVSMAAASYDYQGSNIATTCDVSAWNTSNERIISDVKLVLEGSLYFSDDSQSKTIATSGSAETEVDLVIKGASYSRIVSSVVL